MPSDTEVQQLVIYVGTQDKIDEAKEAGTITENDFAVVTDAPEFALESSLVAETNRAKGVEGTLSSLSTDTKTNLVSAINEVDTHADTNASNIATINGKIPAQASSSNQLADKNFVNSSIATNTANFIGTFDSVEELEAYSGTLTNNDYAFVIDVDEDGNTVYNRYKYTTNTTPASWIYEYTLNNSSFTSNQWEAINSGATITNIGQITTNQNAIGNLSSLATSTKTDLVSAINEVNTTATGKVSDVQMNGTSITTGYVANIPVMTGTTLGVAKVDSAAGTGILSNGSISIVRATSTDLANKNGNYRPLVPSQIDEVVKSGVVSNANTLTAQEKSDARNWLGAGAKTIIREWVG